MRTGEIPPHRIKIMGIIADTFQATIDAMKETDAIRDREIAETIKRCHDLIDSCNLDEDLIED